MQNLERASLVAAALVHDELRQDLAFDSCGLQRFWIGRGVPADLLDSLLNLELHVGAMVCGTGVLPGIPFVAGSALHAARGSTSDTFAAEVILVRKGLGQIDGRYGRRNVHGGRKYLEPLRRG